MMPTRYEMRADVVELDRKHYREGDAARAKELAGAMIQKLSAAMTPKARTVYDRYVRIWTLLMRRYEEVRTAGLWMFRKDTQAQQRFPSLFTAGRPNVGRPKKKDASTGGEGNGSDCSDNSTPAPAVS
jgi:hypothetical protein